MNTIPTIFNERRATYTVVGGKARSGSSGISAILLNRGGRYLRRNVLEDLERNGFDSIVSVEGPQENYDLEELSIRFQSVKFLQLHQGASPGEQINLATDELDSPRFFVIWNDQRLASGGNLERIRDRLDEHGGLCSVPTLQNGRFETLPTFKAPAFYRGTIKTIAFSSGKDGLPTLYPFDGTGIYERERFVRLGGFDPTIECFYWQLMDFGFRAQLWGESIRSSSLLRVRYEGDLPAEDATVRNGYRAFYLKNLAPVFRGDCAHLPIRRFPPYLLRSGSGPLAAWREYLAARRWVNTNRFRYVCDARRVIELWETPDA